MRYNTEQKKTMLFHLKKGFLETHSSEVSYNVLRLCLFSFILLYKCYGINLLSSNWTH